VGVGLGIGVGEEVGVKVGRAVGVDTATLTCKLDVVSPDHNAAIIPKVTTIIPNKNRSAQDVFPCEGDWFGEFTVMAFSL
jgi:hypothetical protein